MKNKQKTLLSFLLAAALIQAAALYVIFGAIYLPSQKTLIMNTLFERAQSRVSCYFPAIKKSLESKNDVALMNSLEEIMKDSEFTYARVIDNEGRIILHNKTQEWGRVLKDDLTLKITGSDSPSFLKTEQGYDFSLPIYSSFTKTASLSAGISAGKAVSAYETIKRKAVKTAVLVFIFTVTAFFLAFQVLVLIPTQKLQARIESVILGRAGEKLDFKSEGVFGSLAEAIDRLIGKLTR